MPNAPATTDGPDARCFAVTVMTDVDGHLVQPIGELDLASRTSMFDACTRPDHRDVVVDLSALRFMDCAGYGSLVAARHELERRGGSLDVRDACDEPPRLIQLVAGQRYAVPA
ncbi:MAG: STAS domain-containing protein [Actinobacteria bacterium]|nr:STAS domain-containing protein [Actinomycetota bacterium]